MKRISIPRMGRFTVPASTDTAVSRRAGFASVDFTTAYRLSKAAGDEQRTFPIFLMVARSR